MCIHSKRDFIKSRFYHPGGEESPVYKVWLFLRRIPLHETLSFSFVEKEGLTQEEVSPLSNKQEADVHIVLLHQEILADCSIN
jgi:hypothetical protein